MEEKMNQQGLEPMREDIVQVVTELEKRYLQEMVRQLDIEN